MHLGRSKKARQAQGAAGEGEWCQAGSPPKGPAASPHLEAIQGVQTSNGPVS